MANLHRYAQKKVMLMKIEENIPLLEDIFSEWKDIIGNEYQGYRNHVYRMVHFCLALRNFNDEMVTH